jgi:hypothetical protein
LQKAVKYILFVFALRVPRSLSFVIHHKKYYITHHGFVFREQTCSKDTSGSFFPDNAVVSGGTDGDTPS